MIFLCVLSIIHLELLVLFINQSKEATTVLNFSTEYEQNIITSTYGNSMANKSISTMNGGYLLVGVVPFYFNKNSIGGMHTIVEKYDKNNALEFRTTAFPNAYFVNIHRIQETLQFFYLIISYSNN